MGALDAKEEEKEREYSYLSFLCTRGVAPREGSTAKSALFAVKSSDLRRQNTAVRIVQVVANKGESGDADLFWHASFRAFAFVIAEGDCAAPAELRRAIEWIFVRSSGDVEYSS